MKVLILGGCGFIGSSIARDLIKSDDVSAVTLADKNTDTTKLAGSIKQSPKISLERIDVTAFSELVGLMRGSDIVVNCIGPFSEQSTDIVRTAMAAGINYTG